METYDDVICSPIDTICQVYVKASFHVLTPFSAHFSHNGRVSISE